MIIATVLCFSHVSCAQVNCELAIHIIMVSWFLQKAEERKNWTKEQKQELKQENEKILEEYGYCLMDGHKQRVGNFKIEPPGLFRGRGDHPKMGKLKKRIRPEDIIINIGKYVKLAIL